LTDSHEPPLILCRLPPLLPVSALVLALTFGPNQLHAQASDPAAAEVLFREGRGLMSAGKYDQACEKFSESNRLDPALGTVFNLADCEERRGHLTRAWTLFHEVVQRLPDGDERRAIAAARAKHLDARLPRLRIRMVASAPVGTRIERDGVELGRASLDTPLPVEPGSHRVVVRAPGHADREFRVSLAAGEARDVEVMPGVATGANPEPTTSSGSGSGQKTAGFVVAGAGLLALAGGVITGAMLLGKKSTVDQNCDASKRCNARGLEAADAGETLGVLTTVALATGAVALGAGTYLVLSAAPNDDGGATSASATLFGRF
jgi:hypothetical protein